MGTERSVGVTHLAFMMANYYANVCGYSVAVLELCVTNSFRQAEVIYNRKSRPDHEYFHIDSITFYKNAGVETISETLIHNYDYVILDFGNCLSEWHDEFIRCSKKIVVGSLSWWRIHNYADFLAITEEERTRKNWIFLGTSYIKRGAVHLKRNFGVSIISMYYEADPLYLGRESVDFLSRIAGY